MRTLLVLALLLIDPIVSAAEMVTVTEREGNYTLAVSTTAGTGKTARSDLIAAPLTFVARHGGKEVHRAALPLIPGAVPGAPRTGRIYLPDGLAWDTATLHANATGLHGRPLAALDALRSTPLARLDRTLLRIAPPPPAPLFPYEKVQETGADQGRIILMVMGDGYTVAEMANFESDAETAIAGLFSIAPWNKRRGAFNIYRVDVVSSQSGADHPEFGTSVDTELDATYNCSGIQRLICVNTSWAQEIAASVAAYDMVMVIVNDDTYGGSGGSVTVTSTHSAAADLVLHEFGHSFGNLADEYEDAYPGYPDGDWEPNVSYAYGFDRSQIKWNLWIDGATPLPTPDNGSYSDAIGMFEGARYKPTGIYRPRETCEMRIYTHQFCEVCTEAQILQIYNLANILEGALPTPGSVTYAPGLSVTVKTLPCDSVSVSFALNGTPLAASCVTGSCTLPIAAQDLFVGSNTLTALVADDTGEVRNDPSLLTQVTLEWTIFLDGIVPDDDTMPDDDTASDDDTTADDTVVDTVIEADTTITDEMDDIVETDADTAEYPDIVDDSVTDQDTATVDDTVSDETADTDGATEPDENDSNIILDEETTDSTQPDDFLPSDETTDPDISGTDTDGTATKNTGCSCAMIEF